MKPTEKDIIHENGSYFVLSQKNCYTVFRNGITHATSDGSYARDKDGMSLAKYRCNYLAKMENKK